MFSTQSKTPQKPGNPPQKPCSSNIREMAGQGGRDWTQPQTAHGSELAAVIPEARAAGYHAHRMKVSTQAVYELQFWKPPAAGTLLAILPEVSSTISQPKRNHQRQRPEARREISKESFLGCPEARQSCIRAPVYERIFQRFTSNENTKTLNHQ